MRLAFFTLLYLLANQSSTSAATLLLKDGQELGGALHLPNEDVMYLVDDRALVSRVKRGDVARMVLDVPSLYEARLSQAPEISWSQPSSFDWQPKALGGLSLVYERAFGAGDLDFLGLRHQLDLCQLPWFDLDVATHLGANYGTKTVQSGTAQSALFGWSIPLALTVGKNLYAGVGASVLLLSAQAATGGQRVNSSTATFAPVIGAKFEWARWRAFVDGWIGVTGPGLFTTGLGYSF